MTYSNRTLSILFILIIPFSLVGQCDLDLSNYELVWFDDFRQYVNKDQVFDGPNPYSIGNGYPDNTYPNWRPQRNNTDCGNTLDGIYFYTRDNISLIEDPNSDNKYLELKSAQHSPEVLGICETYNGNTYYADDNNPLATYDYSSSWLESTWSDISCPDSGTDGFLYGIFEVRCKVSKACGEWNAFWFWNGSYGDCINSDQCTGNYPDNFGSWELDVFETFICNDQGERRMWSTNQPNVFNSSGTRAAYNLNFDPSEDFHTYTLVWTPEKLSYFIDGHHIKTDLETDIYSPQLGIPQTRMPLILSVHPKQFYYNNCTSIENGSFTIDYVKVYKPLGFHYEYNSNNFPDLFPCSNDYNGDPFPSYNNSGWRNHSMKEFVEDIPSISGTTLAIDYNNQNRVYFTSGLEFDYEIIDCPKCPDGQIEITNYTNNLFYVDENGANQWTFHETGVNNVNPNSNLINIGSTIYYVSLDGDIWYFDGTNNDKILVNNSPVLSDGNLLFSPSNNRLYFQIGTNLDYLIQNGSTWYQFKTAVNNMSSSSYSIRPTTGKIFYRAFDNHLWQYGFFAGTGWDKTPIGPYPSTADVASRVRYARAFNKNRVYYRDFQNKLKYWEYTTSGWEKFESGCEDVVKELSVRSEFPACFYIADNGKIKSFLWDNTPTCSPLEFASTTLDLQSITLSKVDDKVFFINSDHILSYYDWKSECGLVNLPSCDSEACQPSCSIQIGYLTPQNNPDARSESIHIASKTPSGCCLISPNPSKNLFTIGSGSDENILNINIYDIAGKHIIKLTNIHSNSYELNLTHHPKGLYIAVIETSNKKYVKQMIKI